MRGKHQGFTLIELMICIALFVIFLAIPATGLFHLQSLQREQDYRHALVNAQGQLERLRLMDFEALPPELGLADQDGWINLRQTDLFSESVVVRKVGDSEVREILEVDLQNGRVRIEQAEAGQRFLVDYDFALPDLNEAHFLDSSKEVLLENRPVSRVEAVWLVQGESRTPSADFQVDLQRGSVLVRDGKPGSLVLVDYYGERLKNRISGSFLDDEFQPTLKLSEVKLLTVAEFYGGGWRMSLPLVRVKP